MEVRKGNIVFRRITADDIELVRQWRNADHVKRYMAYREYITPEMQERWFRSVNNEHNLYFIIEYKGEKIGVFNGKDIDWEKGTMETGIFIAEEKHVNTELPLLAVLSFGELGLRMFDMTSYAHMLRSNARAIRYNKLLGFELCEGQEEEENQLYLLNRDRFFKRTSLLRPALYKLMGIRETVLSFSEEEKKNGTQAFFMQKIKPDVIREVVENDIETLIYFDF